LLITGGRYNPVTNTWQPLSTAGLPALRADAVAVWTGASMIVWGGSGANGLSLNSGGRYDPVNDRWRTMTTGSAPDARVGHTGVWTGSEMIVWGGSTDTSRVNSGGRYAP
jgi:N-acetylneuraminic acid mutarotase